MRALALAGLLLASLLAGCSGGDGDDTTTSCAGPACPTTTTTTCYTPPGSSGTCGPVPTTTSRPPNVPPSIVVKVTDANGTETNATTVGGTLSFDASASTDPDGRLEAIAMVAQQGNRTYPVQVLYADGTFRTANYTLEAPGAVNVTISGIDDRGDLATLQTHAYANFRAVLGETYLFTGAVSDALLHAHECHGPTEGAQPGVDALTWTSHGFEVQNGTTRIVATVVSGSATIALCAPDGTALTEDSTESVQTAEGATFQAASSLDGYYVSVYSLAPNQHVPIEVVVHYDP